MTCNFFPQSHVHSHAHMNPYAHVNTSCLPAFPSACTPFPSACTPIMPMPAPIFHSCHDHHHGVGNSLVLNMCNPCCPQPKHHEVKKIPLDLSRLSIATNPENGEIVTAMDKKPTGQNLQKCVEIIKQSQNDFEIGANGKIVGGCENHNSCKACVDAINSAIIDHRSENKPAGAPTPNDVYDSQDFSTI